MSTASSDVSAPPAPTGTSAAKKTAVTPPKRAIHFVANKGGVGKSILARALVELLRAKTSRKVSAWDLDANNGSSARFYSSDDPLVGIGRDDVTDGNASAWIDALFNDAADDVVYDIPGGKMQYLYQTFASGDAGPAALLKTIRKAGREPIFVTPITNEPDSLIGVLEAVENFGAGARHVIVRNGRFGTPAAFVAYDEDVNPETGAKNEFFAVKEKATAIGAYSIYVPELDMVTTARLSLSNMNFGAAVNAWQTIGRRNATKVEIWLDELQTAFDKTPLDLNGFVARV